LLNKVTIFTCIYLIKLFICSCPDIPPTGEVGQSVYTYE